MLEQKTLADIIKEKVHLGSENSRGFYSVKCAECNDYQERGGFKFDGGNVGYHCWNCGTKFRYEEGASVGYNAKKILESFGISREDLSAIRSNLFGAPPEDASINLEELKRVKLHTPEVALPPRSQPLGVDGHEELQEAIIMYLLDRKIDPLAIKAHFSLEPRFLRRVIIPFYRDRKVIYWQARTIDNVKPRYLNCEIAKDAVIYGYDKIYSYDTTPLFVTEGIFDAAVLGGICLIGSTLNAAKIEVLKKTKRRIIFVIDRDRPGGLLGQLALDNGWELSFVDIRAKDANDSVIKFGLPYTIYSLLQNATTNLTKMQGLSQAHLAMGLLEERLRNRK